MLTLLFKPKSSKKRKENELTFLITGVILSRLLSNEVDTTRKVHMHEFHM